MRGWDGFRFDEFSLMLWLGWGWENGGVLKYAIFFRTGHAFRVCMPFRYAFTILVYFCLPGDCVHRQNHDLHECIFGSAGTFAFAFLFSDRLFAK